MQSSRAWTHHITDASVSVPIGVVLSSSLAVAKTAASKAIISLQYNNIENVMQENCRPTSASLVQAGCQQFPQDVTSASYSSQLKHYQIGSEMSRYSEEVLRECPSYGNARGGVCMGQGPDCGLTTVLKWNPCIGQSTQSASDDLHQQHVGSRSMLLVQYQAPSPSSPLTGTVRACVWPAARLFLTEVLPCHL